jgi:hypothetical protein
MVCPIGPKNFATAAKLNPNLGQFRVLTQYMNDVLSVIFFEKYELSGFVLITPRMSLGVKRFMQELFYNVAIQICICLFSPMDSGS